MLKKYKNNQGFSLLEILLVLAVAAAFVVGAFLLLPKAQDGVKADKDIRSIMMFQNEIKRLYTTQTNYNGLSASLLIQTKIAPESMLENPGSTSSDILNAFGGKVIPGIVTSGFTLSYGAIPPAACAKIIPAVAGSFYAVMINNATVKNTNGGVSMDLANAIAQCNTQQSNTLLFYSN